ncbi:hypothetical protein BGLA2_280015 [Burkholderia gladioli]|nr:hypothetical protein BGLA2_280015 [Burkholderia gladioli]
MRRRPARARGGAPGRRAPAFVVLAGHVRHLQGQACVGPGGDEAQRRHPPARDRPGHGAAVLQQALVGSGGRQVRHWSEQYRGKSGASRMSKDVSENDDTGELWLRNLERPHRATLRIAQDNPKEIDHEFHRKAGLVRRLRGAADGRGARGSRRYQADHQDRLRGRLG